MWQSNFIPQLEELRLLSWVVTLIGLIPQDISFLIKGEIVVKRSDRNLTKIAIHNTSPMKAV
jgi:hypothetical protein